MKGFKDKSGFTLIEVMISLAIVGGLLMTLIYTLNYNLGITDRQFILTNMTLLAKVKIGEMEQQAQNHEGRFPGPYEAYHYRTEVKDSKFTGFSEIVVTVGNGREKVVLSELMRKRNEAVVK